MDTVWIVLGIISVVIIVLAIGLHFYKKRNLNKFFEQIFVNVQQVPKSKKQSFILLMFKEALFSSRKKNQSSFESKMSNQKYVEVQLMQMSRILKNPAGDHDKKVKQSLKMLKDYNTWEEARRAALKA